jgi:hypothetical protein
MSCVLRVSGSEFSVDDALRKIPLRPIAIWRAGEPRLGPETFRLGNHQESGFNVAVSEKEMDDLPGQIHDAITFLQVNEESLIILMNYPGVEHFGIDFAVARREDTPPATSMYFPAELIAAASKFRMSLAISEYETSD